MSEHIKVIVDDDELRALIPLLNDLMFKKALILDEGFESLQDIQGVADAVDMEVQATVDRLTAEIAGVEAQAEGLEDMLHGIDLPTVDRGTRMILLRIPGLREVLRLLYAISMLRRTLNLGEIRGPLTALTVSLLYISMTLTQMQRKQERIDARMDAMEREMTKRLVTMEEAVRGYGILPERYRTTVIQ